MTQTRRRFLQTLTALLGLPAISAVAAPDKELTEWYAKEKALDPTFEVAKDPVGLDFYARIFGQTFLIDGELRYNYDQPPSYPFLNSYVRPDSIHRTMTIRSQDPEIWRALWRLQLDGEHFVEIGVIVTCEPEDRHKLFLLHGVRVVNMLDTRGLDLSHVKGLQGLDKIYAELSYRMSEVDATEVARFMRPWNPLSSPA